MKSPRSSQKTQGFPMRDITHEEHYRIRVLAGARYTLSLCHPPTTTTLSSD